jgi:ankyrin repeat protein/beta-lactamase regulating signal transducer with metallopeptidase domain
MSDVLERIGWVLIHSLWQEILLGAIAWLGCLLLKSSSASIRYNFLCGCLLACGFVPVLTWFWLDGLDSEQRTNLVPFSPQNAESVWTKTVNAREPSALAFFYRAIPVPALNYVRLHCLLQQWLRAAAVSWAIFVLFFFSRTFCDYRELLRLTSSARAIPKRQKAKRRYVAQLATLTRRMGIKRTVSLMESARIDVPSVVGWFKPIVLVPVALLGSMPPDQIEAILAHELAHVRRCDYFINLLQIVIETLLFYHFAVRWISRVIREERENCCDDIAIAVAGNKEVYVSALAAIAERSLSPEAFVMAADGGSLIKRVRRVLGAEQPKEIWGVVLARQAYVGMLLGVLMIGLCSAISLTTEHSSVTRHVDKLYLTKALVTAAETGNVLSMETLIRQGAEVNRNVPPTAENALFAATTHNHMDVVDLLLRSGASIDARTDSGMRAIDWALATGNFPLVKFLHDRGAQMSRSAWAAVSDDIVQLKSIATESGFTNGQQDELMKYAVCMGYLDEVRFLEKMTRKPILGKFLVDAASAGDIPMMAYILKQGADIQIDGTNAMEQAVMFYDQPEAVRFLLRHGANPNHCTSYWNRYLLSEAQDAKMVKVLLEGGANPNSRDSSGTPLSAAPDAESVRLMVQNGANLHPDLGDGISLIESAIMHDRRDKPDVIKELIRQGASFDPRGNGLGALALAAARNKVDTMKCLLDLGVNPNAFVDEGFMRSSVMHSAVTKSSIDAVKLLLEQGCPAKGDSRDGSTPSSLALLSGDQDMVNLLREGGAREIGDLSMAAAFGDVNEVNDLIRRGVDVNQTDAEGRTPLFYALSHRQTSTAQILIQHGAIVHNEQSEQLISRDSR